LAGPHATLSSTAEVRTHKSQRYFERAPHSIRFNGGVGAASTGGRDPFRLAAAGIIR
jgi:hypothetical protein